MSKVLSRSWESDSSTYAVRDDIEPLTPLAPIDYRKGPMRAALVQAAQILDERHGTPGHTLVNSAAQILMDAMSGDKSAIQFIADRFDGKPAQAVQVTGEDGGPVQFADVSQLEVARRIAFLLSRGVNLLPTDKKDSPSTKTLKGETYDG